MRRSPEWIEAAGPLSVARRRLVAATYILDVAQTALDNSSRDEFLYRLGGERTSETRDIETALEWSCQLLRSDADAFDETWFVASVDLARYVGLSREFLYGSASAPGALLSRFTPGHLAHALSMFPNDPRLKLAAAEEPRHAWLGTFAAAWLTDEERSLILRRREIAPEALSAKLQTAVGVERRLARGESINPADDDLLVDAQRLAVLQPAAAALPPLLAFPSIRPLVDLHLGCISLCLGEREAALRYFADIGPDAPACPQYLGRLFSGRIQDLEHRPNEAEQSYRAAAAIMPQLVRRRLCVHHTMSSVRCGQRILQVGGEARTDATTSAGDW